MSVSRIARYDRDHGRIQRTDLYTCSICGGNLSASAFSLRAAPNSGAETGTEESAIVTRHRPDSRVSPPSPHPYPDPDTLPDFVRRPSRRRRRLELSAVVYDERRQGDPIAIERRAADHRRGDGVVPWFDGSGKRESRPARLRERERVRSDNGAEERTRSVACRSRLTAADVTTARVRGRTAVPCGRLWRSARLRALSTARGCPSRTR